MNLAPDDLLLVKALRYCLGTLEIDEINGWNDSEWQGLFTNAVQHGVSSFIWHHFNPVATNLEMPMQVVGEFESSYIRCAGRGFIIRNQLEGLLQVIESIEKPVIVLKGSYLADKVYGDFSLRPMSDIDILVKPADVYEIERALLVSGYKAIKPTSDPIWCNHYVYKPISNGVRVEVHLDLRAVKNDHKFYSNELWERSEDSIIVGRNARILGLEDVITYHCHHQAKHFLKHFGLRSLCDLALLLKIHSNKIDWNLLTTRAVEWCALKEVELCMKLIAFHYHVPLSPSFRLNQVSSGLQIPALKSFNFEIFGSKKSKDSTRSTNEAPTAISLFDSFKNGSIVKLFFRAAFPPKRQIRRRFSSEVAPRPIIYLYAANIKRLVIRYARLLWKIARGNAELKAEINSLTEKSNWFNSR